MPNMINQSSCECCGEELASLGRIFDMLDQLLFANASVIQLIIMQPLFQILSCDGLVVGWDNQQPGDGQYVSYDKWREQKHSVQLATKFMFIGCQCYAGRGGEVGGQ